MADPVRIATRSSELARFQATFVGQQLGVPFVLVEVSTSGDRDVAKSLREIAGQGVFVKEVQQAVLSSHADIAVHSAKDMPTASVDGLHISAVLRRADPRDAMVGVPFDRLEEGARVGTSSARRMAMLRRIRPDLKFIEIRGNIATRIAKSDELDAVVVAKAALDRLGLSEKISYVFEPDELCPQIGQGTLAVESRLDRNDLASVLGQIDDLEANRTLTAERALLAQLGSGCSLPVGAFGVAVEDLVDLYAIVASLDGSKALEVAGTGGDPEAIGMELGRRLIDMGAMELL